MHQMNFGNAIGNIHESSGVNRHKVIVKIHVYYTISMRVKVHNRLNKIHNMHRRVFNITVNINSFDNRVQVKVHIIEIHR